MESPAQDRRDFPLKRQYYEAANRDCTEGILRGVHCSIREDAGDGARIFAGKTGGTGGAVCPAKKSEPTAGCESGPGGLPSALSCL